jgi:HEAT repeat protein
MVLAVPIVACNLFGGGAKGGTTAAASRSNPNVVTGKDQKNDITEKYFDFKVSSGNYQCIAKGVLKTLKDKPYDCLDDLANCKAGYEALQGKLDPKAIEMFNDAIVMWPDGASRMKDSGFDRGFKWSCQQSEFSKGPMLGVSGLGFVGTPEQQGKALAAFLSDKALRDGVASRKHAIIRSLYYMGAKDQIPAINEALKDGGYTHDHQPIGLEFLARWGSDAAVEWCTALLKGDESGVIKADSGTTNGACIRYLGRRKAKAAVPIIVRNFEKSQAIAVRALGLIGDAGGAAPLEALLKKEKNPANRYSYRIPAIVGLINIGQKKHFKELEGYMKKGNADARRQAAMEIVNLQNPGLRKKAMGLLKKAMNQEEDDWQPRIFAIIALAQLGDAAAADQLAKELEGPKADVRIAILETVGGNENPTNDFGFYRRGLGVVPHKPLISALLKYYDTESNHGNRRMALIAALNIRAVTR